jgi:uncharacterized membrane protein YfcA
MPVGVILLLFGAGLWAGTQNALAGGGSFVTLPSLMVSGLDARGANITSTIALFPGQVTTGWAGRKGVVGTERLSFKAFFLISLIGGVVGALLLLLTPPSFFAKLVPWLVLFATTIFAWGSFFRKPHEHAPVSAMVAGSSQFLISIYGGYFGGGIGFLMLAALTFAGLKIRAAGATKNVLAAVMNASAVVIFLFSKEIAWLNAVILGTGAVVGGLIGAHLLQRINERALRIGIVILGLALTVGLFWKAR